MNPIHLNIVKHYPSEFVGKTFSVNGATYIVQSYLAQGQERVVYRVLNGRSKISQHVLKIMRDQSSLQNNGAYTGTPESAHRSAEHNLAEVFVPDINGFAFIQPALEMEIPPYEDTLTVTAHETKELLEIEAES